MNKNKIIRKSETYTEIISQKHSVKSMYFSIYYIESNDTLYGITVPKKIGKAHIRNKVKRQIKNIIITNENNIQTYYNYVIIIKEAALKLDYASLEKELLNLMKKVRKINEN